MKILVISDYSGNPHMHRPEIEGLIGLHNYDNVTLQVATNAESYHGKQLKELGIKVYDFVPKKKIGRKEIAFIKTMLGSFDPDIIYAVNNKAISNSIIATKNHRAKVVAYRGAGKIYWYDPTFYLTYLNPGLSAVICLSKAVEAVVKKQNWYRNINTSVVYKAQREEWFEGVDAADLSEFGIPKNAFVVGSVANYRKTKGFEYLLKSAEYFPENLPIYFLLIGKDTDMRKMQALAKNSPYADNIKLVGHRKDILNLTKAFSTSVLASTKIEGLGKSIMESMAYAVPPIVTDSGGPIELVDNGESGSVIPMKDSKAIADAIMFYYQNEENRKQAGENAQKKLFNEFTVEIMSQSLFKAFSAILN